MMALKPLTNGFADVGQKLELLRQRQKDIVCSGYFTAFVMDKIRQEKNKKLGGNGNGS